MKRIILLSLSVLLVFCFSNANATDYYYNGSTAGNMFAVTTNWGTNPDGSGSNPANFTTASQIFHVVNGASFTQIASWTVSGAGSRIIFGDGATAMTVQFNATLTATTAGMVDVTTNVTLKLNYSTTTTSPAFGTISSGTTVDYMRTGVQYVLPATYYNLTTSGSGTKTLAGNVTVSNTLTLGAILAVAAKTLTFYNAIAGTNTNLTTTTSSSIVLKGTVNNNLPATFANVNNLTLDNSAGLSIGGNLLVNGILTLTTGTFTVGANTLTLKKPIAGTTSNFAAGATSSLTVQSNSAFPLPTTVSDLNNLNVTNTGTAITFTLSSALLVHNTLTLGRGSFVTNGFLTMDTGTKIIVGTGTGVTNGTITTEPNATTTYDVEYQGTTTIASGNEIPSTTTKLRHLIMNRGVTTALVNLSKNFTINGNLTITSGVLGLTTRTVTLKGDLSNATGVSTSVREGTSTLIIDGGGNDITTNTEFNLYNLTINAAGALTLPNTNALILKGNLVNNGTLTHNSGEVKFGGSTTLSGSSAINLYNANIISGGTLTGVSAGTFGVAGNFVNDGTFNANAGTINFNGVTATSGASANTFNNVTIDGTLSIGAATTVEGNFTNNGTFTHNNFAVNFNSASVKDIGGSVSTTFYDMNINAGTVRLEGNNADLINTLTIAAGATFDANGSGDNRVFTLISDGTGTARIATIPATGTLSGTVRMQRYTTGASPMWTVLGTPVQSQTLYNWQSSFPTSGYSGASGYAGGFVSIYGDDETLATSRDDENRYVPPVDSTDAITVGKGYWVYLGDMAGTTRNVTINMSGTPQVNRETTDAAFSFNVSYSTAGAGNANYGWCLVSNPFPCEIDWLSASGWSKTNMDDAIYYYDDLYFGVTGNYRAFVAGISEDGTSTQYIASSQAFYVKANAAGPSLTADERIKATVAGGPTFFKTQSADKSLVRLRITNSNNDKNHTVVHFNSAATTGFDSQYDAYDMSTLGLASYFSINTISNGISYGINGQPELTGNTSFPVSALVPTAGTYTISASAIENIPQEYCIKLYDTYTGTYTNLRNNSYTVTLSDTTTQPRFVLSFESNSALTFNTSITQPTCSNSNNSVTVTPAGSGPWNITWLDANGNIIQDIPNTSTASSMTNLSSGEYKVVVTDGSLCGYAENRFSINDVTANTATFNSVNESCAGTNNGEISVTPAGNGPWTYTWFDSNNNVIREVTNSNSPDKLTNIGAGTYSVNVSFASGCNVNNQTFTLTSVDAPVALFNAPADTIDLSGADSLLFINQSTGSTYYEWMVSGDSTIYYGDTLMYSFTGAGTYTVSINAYEFECEGVTSYSKDIVVTDITTKAPVAKANDETISIGNLENGAFIRFNYADNSDAVITVYNALGQQLMDNIKVKANNQTVNLNFSKFESQVLFVTVTTKNNRISKKLINY